MPYPWLCLACSNTLSDSQCNQYASDNCQESCGLCSAGGSDGSTTEGGATTESSSGGSGGKPPKSIGKF